MRNTELYQRLVVNLALGLLLLSSHSLARAGENPHKSVFDGLPAEFRPSDPQITQLLESAYTDSDNGDRNHASAFLQDALKVCTSKKLVSDCAIVETAIGYQAFTMGHLQDAERIYRSALRDAQESGNLTLQAELLVSLASAPRIDGRISDALDLVSQALDIARKGKSLYEQSRAYGEYASLKLAAGDLKSSHEAISRALEIDGLNNYDSRPLHL